MINRFLIQWIILALAFLWSALGLAERELTYRTEKFSQLAHQLMDDHGFNAVYHVKLEGVCSFLPEKNPIRKKITKRIDNGSVPIKWLVKLYRHLLLKPVQYPQSTTLRHAIPRDFFASFREGIPHTYVVLDHVMIFTESTNCPLEDKFKDRFSKHYILSGLSDSVRYAGEFYVYKNSRNKNVFLVFDNASGTFQPSGDFLPKLKLLLEHNFSRPKGRLYFITKTFDQKIDRQKLLAHDSRPFIVNK